MIDKIIAIIGLPRSGTTLVTSLLAAHPDVDTCFEPWNRNREQRPSPELSPDALLTHFELPRRDNARVLVLKETTVDFLGIQWLARFLQHNEKRCRIEVLWTVRCYRHSYLSFIQTGREEWGNEQMTLNPRSYTRWVTRSREATLLLADLYRRHPSAVYAYEALTRAPEPMLRRLCDAVSLPYIPEMLDFHRLTPKEHVHGDRELAMDPQPVSERSIDRREQQWLDARDALEATGINAVRERLDAFWQDTAEAELRTGDAALAPLQHMLERWPGPLASGIDHQDCRMAFDSRTAWQQFMAQNRRFYLPDAVNETAQAVLEQGFQFDGDWIRPSAIEGLGESYREGLNAHGLNSRQRAVWHELKRELHERELSADAARIYAPEYLSTLAKKLREHYPGFRGSEYLEDKPVQRHFSSVPHEDLGQLSFAERSFDAVLVNDIFEHVPDLPKVLGEIHRVLDTGGVLLSTFPFAFKRDEGIERARLREDGSIEHLLPPEYHGDPVKREGVLVFTIPGWNILDQCRAAGFAEPQMLFLCLPSQGIVGGTPEGGLGGIIILRAQRTR